MIGRLTGTVIQTNQDRIIVDVNGVGYLVRVIQRDFTKIPNRQTSTLYIYTHVKEDALDLFGFLNEDDLSVFKNLITVSGVGPKIGLSILSSYPAEEIKKAITEADTNFFLSVSGVGKKNAQKIIVELKSKFGSVRELDLSADEKQKYAELIEALKSLGYKVSEIRPLLKNLPPEVSGLEEQVRYALKSLR